MSRKSAEKKKLKKQKQKQKLEAKLKEEQIKLPVLKMLKTAQLDTKPNVGKFLKENVSCISIHIPSKVILYPTFSYSFSRAYVKFIDGHTLGYIKDRIPEQYFYEDGIDDIELTPDDEMLIRNFFAQLEKFKFIY